MARSEEGKERQRQLNRDHNAARKLFWQTWIAHKDGFDHICCVECGLPETDPHNPLQYSHNNPAIKSFNLSPAITRFLRKTPEEIEAEAQKCSLRHRRCHSTFDNNTVYGPDGIPHGCSGYTWHGCRCQICVADHNEQTREAMRNCHADPAKREAYNKYMRDLRATNPAVNKRRREARATKRALKNLVPPKEWSTPQIESN